MPSKIVTEHQKVTETVAAAIRTHGGAIVAGVRAVTAETSPERPVEVGPLLDHVLAAMNRRLTELLTTDNAHEAELSDDHGPRASRDEASARLYRVVVDLKQGTERLFGDGWVKQLSFPAVIPMEHAMLARTATQVIKALGTHGLPQSLIPGVQPVDPGSWVAVLSPPLAELAAARALVEAEEQEAQGTRTVRDAALAALVRATVDANQLVQSLARLGRVSELVEGLRGTLDRSGPSRSAPVDPPKAPVADPVADPVG